MLKKLLLFFCVNGFFIALLIVFVEVGYRYDQTHHLYPEMKELSYDTSLQVYGERWVRFGKALFALGLIVDSAVLLVWYRKRQNACRDTLDLNNNL